MAKPRHKGKSKQRKNTRPKVVIETTATRVSETENKEEIVEDTVEQETQSVEELTPAEIKKQDKLKAKQDKQLAEEKDKKKKQEAREKAGKVSVGQRLRETGSELKKISWPSFKETMKKTGVVLAVVIFFTAILFAFDYLLSLLNGLLI